MGVRVIRLTCCAVVALTALSACGDATGPSPDGLRPDVSSWVTADVASQLDASGHFVFPTPPASTVAPTISAEQAVNLASAFIRTFVTNPNVVTFGTPIRKVIEDTHGAPVDWNAVGPARWTPFYMESPVLPIGDSIPGFLRRSLGPRYHVLYFDRGSAVVDVAVSAYATDVWIDQNGFLRDPPPPEVSGEETEAHGLPASYGATLPLLPEVAVRDVAEATGSRIAALPRLVGPWNHYAPVYARWRLRLDRAIDVVLQDSGERRLTDEVYVGCWGDSAGPTTQWFIAAPDQPASELLPYSVPGDSGVTWDSLLVHFDPDIPTKLVPVRTP